LRSQKTKSCLLLVVAEYTNLSIVMEFTPQMLQRIRELLGSPLPANQQLALTLIRAHGLPEAFRDELLIAYLPGNDRQQVTIGLRLAQALGPQMGQEALWFRYLAIGTVGTSYGWSKPFLSPAYQEKANLLFRKIGILSQRETVDSLQILQEELPGLEVAHVAKLLCMAGERVPHLVQSGAFRFLLQEKKEAYYLSCLQGMLRKDELRLSALSQLPEAIQQLEGLRKLHLYGLQQKSLGHFPQVLLGLPHLSHLFLQMNQVTEIPDEIDRMKGLVVLDLKFNPLQSLPETIARLPRLKVLAVSSPMIGEGAKADLRQIRKQAPAGLKILEKES
jgi:hypothetical protein